MDDGNRALVSASEESLPVVAPAPAVPPDPEAAGEAAVPDPPVAAGGGAGGGAAAAQAPAANVLAENSARREIENVVWIVDEGPVAYRAALQEWDRKEKYLISKVDRKEKRSADLTNQIFNIVGFFSVFQGVVLTAVSQLSGSGSTRPLCGMVWVPALLSVVAGLVTIGGVWIKFSTLQELEISIFNEKIAQREVAARVTKLRAEGRNFCFTKHAFDRRLRKSNSWIGIYILAVIVSVVVFTGLFVVSYVVILCRVLEVHKWN